MYISKTAQISPSAKIIGDCIIEDNVVIYGECYIEDCHISKNTTVWSSTLKHSHIGADCTVGPYAHLRQNCNIADNVRIGNFVEIKHSTIGSGSKASHLTYIGDATIGKGCNIGCGVIFCNYDGKHKHKTIIGDNVFIGCNVNIIAPITIDDNCFIAAGSTVTNNTPKDTFVIARARQINKPKKEE